MDPCISHEDNDTLLSPISDLEIDQTLRRIGPLKAPDPDGIHATFHQNCWEETKPVIKALIQDFFANQQSLKPLNHTNIVLIPKVNSHEWVHQFRPSSLCNVSYKIIAKIIINHIKPLLSK